MCILPFQHFPLSMCIVCPTSGLSHFIFFLITGSCWSHSQGFEDLHTGSMITLCLICCLIMFSLCMMCCLFVASVLIFCILFCLLIVLCVLTLVSPALKCILACVFVGSNTFAVLQYCLQICIIRN